MDEGPQQDPKPRDEAAIDQGEEDMTANQRAKGKSRQQARHLRGETKAEKQRPGHELACSSSEFTVAGMQNSRGVESKESVESAECPEEEKKNGVYLGHTLMSNQGVPGESRPAALKG